MSTIFVLDDDLAFLEQIKILLTSLGHTPKLSLQSEQLYNRLSVEDCDLILLDMHMPGKDGLNILQELKSNPEYEYLPIIMLTADTDEQILEKCFYHGAMDFINKPVRPVILKNRIQAALRIKEFQDRLIKKNNELELKTAELHTSQLKLAKILDIADNAIITANEKGNVSFINRKAENILGYSSGEILGKPIELFIDSPSDEYTRTDLLASDELNLTGKNEQTAQITLYPKQKSSKQLNSAIFKLDFQGGHLETFIFQEGAKGVSRSEKMLSRITSRKDLKENIEKSQERIQALEGAVEGVFKLLSRGGEHLLNELRSVEDSMSSMGDYLNQTYKTDDLNQKLLELMELSLNYWENMAGKTKIELAEESGIWKIYIDKDTVRTRTLDRYLSIETFPKKPRWKDVLATAQFVASHPEVLPSERLELEEKIKALEDILSSGG